MATDIEQTVINERAARAAKYAEKYAPYTRPFSEWEHLEYLANQATVKLPGVDTKASCRNCGAHGQYRGDACVCCGYTVR